MGRIHGFLGGVLLASSVTYYTGEYFRKNQQFISSSLQQSKNIIDNRILSDKEINKPIVPANNYVNRTHSSFGETCKDIWNDEIITMVNWIYSINWYQLGINVDKQVVDLTDRLADVVKK